jgi:hypothetical protein
MDFANDNKVQTPRIACVSIVGLGDHHLPVPAESAVSGCDIEARIFPLTAFAKATKSVSKVALEKLSKR